MPIDLNDFIGKKAPTLEEWLVISKDVDSSNYRPGPPAEHCFYRGGLVSKPGTAKEGSQWVQCNHKLKPLKTVEDPSGSSVCGCRGCGPSCSGYTLKPPLSLPPVTTRHLLFHLYPLQGSNWKWHVDQILKRLDFFNGRISVALVIDPPEGRKFDPIGTDPGREFPICDTAATVIGRFGESAKRIQFKEFENDPNLREALTFHWLMEQLPNEPGHGALYAQGKGVSRTKGYRVQNWIDILWEANCDHWPVVDDLLKTHETAGCFKVLGHPQHWPQEADWHYSGSWFWFRPERLFSLPKWREIGQWWGSIEAYPSTMWTKDKAGCIFFEDQLSRMNLYDARMWDRVLPQWANWQTEQGHGLKVELGGGEKARPGFIDISKESGIKFDFETLAEGKKIPLADDSVTELYSSHCIEHVRALVPLMREIVRICRIGALVEIRVPHPLSSMAMTHGHVQTIAPEQIRHWTENAVEYWFGGCAKRLELVSSETVKGGNFDRWQKMLPGASEKDILDLCPDAAHESIYRFEVIAHE